MGIVYSAIGKCSLERANIISEAVRTEKNLIILPKYPYEEYLWMSTPVEENRIEYYKEFYGIPEDMEILFE